ncbi:hypothetical protein GKR50_11625 [Providencia rustigianii]|uniref:hypothetical protein n=1 Tax=Providencia rustigianii TaxID=158850 RepID=UPI000F6DA835|nr:hypothetical protein [Providencia rustigianii]MTC60662.1 hypothetical protein [Providencia rustigianii]VEH57123.1 Uncharacterised protein [Providencia rustigianii]
MNKIDSRFHKNVITPIKAELTSAKSLIDHNRVDIIVKVAYLHSLLKNDINSINYYEKLYLETIDSFTRGTFHEPGNSTKKSPQDYIHQFKILIDDINQNGFDQEKSLIPISPHGTPLDGAHRIAIASYLNLELPVVKLKDIDCKYDINFFQSRSNDPKFIYKLIDELINFDDNIRIAIIWPFAKVEQIQDIKDFFGNEFIFSLSMNLNNNGVNNLCASAYESENWIGSSLNNWGGTWNKSEKTFLANYKTHIVIYKSISSEHDILLKTKFRAKYKNSKHCIHTTDSKNETIKISQVTFYPDSEKYLNNIELAKLKGIYKFVTDNFINTTDIVVTGSYFLSVLGLRKSNDIDFFIKNDHLASNKKLLVESHNDYIKCYDFSLDDIFNFKTSTFNFLNIRFLPLEQICSFKKKRKERKDFDDIKLIELFLNESYGLKLKFLKSKKNLTYTTSKMKRAFRNSTIDLIKKVGLYNKIKTIMKK